jgi:hypothetical protein
MAALLRDVDECSKRARVGACAGFGSDAARVVRVVGIDGDVMTQDSGVAAIAHVIQLSVAPVFLISGIGAFLTVMTNRLARAVDRARALEAGQVPGPPDPAAVHAELCTLSRRTKLMSFAIGASIITALLVSVVIVVLFLAAFFAFDASVAVALLFIGAMVALFAGLLAFLREILLATAALRIGYPS